ncbi:MAG: hypothetical protein OXC48_10210 [Endozoicomonadaceae bacterium]|nr:hypothetical protein [Endozoicomonadaceae bacterium]
MKQLLFLLTIIYATTGFAYAGKIVPDHHGKKHSFSRKLKYIFSINPNGTQDNDKKTIALCHKALSQLSANLNMKVLYFNTVPKSVYVTDNGFGLSATLYRLAVMGNKTYYTASYHYANGTFTINGYTPTNISVQLASKGAMLEIEVIFASKKSDQRCIVSNSPTY